MGLIKLMGLNLSWWDWVKKKKKGEKAYSISNKGNVTTSPAEMTIWKYDEENIICANKLKNLDDMEKFLWNFNFIKLMSEDVENFKCYHY